MKRAQEDQYQHLLCQNGASESSKIKFVEHKSKQKLFHSLVRKAFISFGCLDAFDPDTCLQFFNDTFINFSLKYKLKNYCAKVEYFETVGTMPDQKTRRSTNSLEPLIPSLTK